MLPLPITSYSGGESVWWWETSVEEIGAHHDHNIRARGCAWVAVLEVSVRG